ncbi:MAG: 3-deoxy-manno-octulosonate cytidylyltransferase [Deltaproteobacteria bacterium]|jgi:3-deoxy-manno-octulosonate cytidylyltransferase (CMP-KDO synthetase)|nr:3-deoxy-manno-octulosonate cytidylyltransferase [Deltaproteobacteria bacterium]MBT4266241.1 3-deoxy-manno-octulosonate cytidylyltransferase [Deltaproteobacteria bacterium]MBT4639952.1 3-deoxy-manno-octulosonate cytidylyltransferase [Deltaproteobacteria bacterium]MBT6500947.1 3-deoxy-manno-octulosonate cytidylyltransferase [Deltaproteobacteria bacterium]MBT6611450.1 3-deoxy-manno-octulosonate cytidylyltransferase [Deltaproteobacteria bacterium]
MKLIVIVPARIGSERMPNKPLLKFNGKTMVRHTIDRIMESGLQPVALASDSSQILDACSNITGLYPVMTSSDHKCGTERVLEAYDILARELGEFDFIINVQGDEPFISPELLRQLPGELEKRKNLAEFWTTVTELPEAEKGDRNVAKVVLDMQDNALVFTRDPIGCALKHTSIYIYTPGFLRKFCKMEQSPLEKAYSLEQMRALDNGLKLNCIPLPFDAISVNTYEDLEKAGIQNYEVYQG